MGNEPATDTAAQEDRRQRAVESLGLQVNAARSAREERLDRITRLARTVFDVDWTSITVLDRDRAWFPSTQGFEPVVVDRDETFCDRTTDVGQTVVVEDASLDPHYRDLSGVVDLGIRFYAGTPLTDAAGNAVAVFCIYDREPRTLDGPELQTFLDLAAWAQHELVASTEMTQAGRVQASMLPAGPIRIDGWDINGVCLPAQDVGGDVYDYDLSDGVVHLGLGDVMGKGTGAALVGAGVRAAIRGTHAAVVAGVDLGVTTTQVARSLNADLERAESFVTHFQAAIDLDDGFTRYVDAGMGLCLLLRADGEVVRLAGDDRPLGVLPDDHWTERQLTLEPGDRMLVFSDGLLDLVDDPVEWWHPVRRLVGAHREVAGLLSDISQLAVGRVAVDDVTALAVFRRGGEEP